MAVEAPAVKLGPVAWGDVVLDANEVATILTGFVDRGSKLSTVAATDPDTRVKIGPKAEDLKNINDCLNAGMKIFDAIVWLKSGKVKPLQNELEITETTIPSLSDVARAVFYNYFFLLTQAKYPTKANNTAVDQKGEKIPQKPAFLAKLLGLDKDPWHYADLICGFEITKFDPSWIRYYKSTSMGREAVSRFGLGVAGYRMCGPFKFVNPDTEEAKLYPGPIEFVKHIARSVPNWCIHPLTRDIGFLSAVGNFNDNLNNMILECYKKETIDTMVRDKMLYAYPQRKLRNNEWKAWSMDTYTLLDTPIFS